MILEKLFLMWFLLPHIMRKNSYFCVKPIIHDIILAQQGKQNESKSSYARTRKPCESSFARYKRLIIGLGIWRVCIRATCVQNRLAYVSRDEPKTANCNLFIDNRKRYYYIKYRYNGTNSVWSFYLPFVNSWVAKTFDILRQKVSGASCYVNVCGTLVFVKVWKACSKSWLV